MPNQEGVRLKAQRADLIITFTLNTISWLGGGGVVIDRLHPRCQGGPATPMLTKAEIKEQQELNYTFSKDL